MTCDTRRCVGAGGRIVIAAAAVLVLVLPVAMGIASPEAGGATAQSVEDVEFRKGTLPPDTPGLTLPSVLKSVRPPYTPEAMNAQIQGTVELEIVVMPDGTVGRVRVIKSLDAVHGLDKAAVTAIEKWTFRPAMLQGQPVTVWSSAVMSFKLS